MHAKSYLLEAIILRLVPVGTVFRVQVGVEGVEVDPSVDAGVSEGGHAAVVVGGRVDVVDANGVGTEGLHQVGIEAALLGVDEGVIFGELVCDALSMFSEGSECFW